MSGEKIQNQQVAEVAGRVSRKRGGERKKKSPLGALFAAFNAAGLKLPSEGEANALLSRAENFRNAAEQSETRAAFYIQRDGSKDLPNRDAAESVVETLTVAFTALRDSKSAKALRIVAIPNPDGGSPLYRVHLQLSMPRETATTAARATGGVLTF